MSTASDNSAIGNRQSAISAAGPDAAELFAREVFAVVAAAKLAGQGVDIREAIKVAFRRQHGLGKAAVGSAAVAGPFGDKAKIPPLPEWVTAYSASVGYPMDGEKWCAGYEAKGWIVGRTRMKNWQAAVINWRTNRWGLGSVTLGAVKGADGKGRDYSKI